MWDGLDNRSPVGANNIRPHVQHKHATKPTERLETMRICLDGRWGKRI